MPPFLSSRCLIWVASLIGSDANDLCYLPLDILILQDTSYSFKEDLTHVRDAIPHIYDAVSKTHKGTRIGLAEFKDKPIWPLGYDKGQIDFCYKLNQPLTADMNDFKDTFNDLYGSGGADFKESSIHALIHAAKDTSVGWRSVARSASAVVEGEARARLIFLSTDAESHEPGDWKGYPRNLYPELPEELPPSTGGVESNEHECATQDYPSIDQLSQALETTNTKVVFLIPQNSSLEHVYEYWSWVNAAVLKQPDNFVQRIEEASANMFEVVLNAIKEFTAHICWTSTSTTPVLATGKSASIDGKRKVTEKSDLERESTPKVSSIPATTEVSKFLEPRSRAAELDIVHTASETKRSDQRPGKEIKMRTTEPTQKSTSAKSESDCASTSRIEPCPCSCFEQCNCCPDVLVQLQQQPAHFRLELDQ